MKQNDNVILSHTVPVYNVCTRMMLTLTLSEHSIVKCSCTCLFHWIRVVSTLKLSVDTFGF